MLAVHLPERAVGAVLEGELRDDVLRALREAAAALAGRGREFGGGQAGVVDVRAAARLAVGPGEEGQPDDVVRRETVSKLNGQRKPGARTR